MSANINIEKLPITERSLKLKSKFVETYHHEPDFYVRVPGRVNLIGEHIDYSGYGVCPMALQQDILLAVGVRDSDTTLNLSNMDSKYTPHTCDIASLKIDLKGAAPSWYQYFLCGAKGIAEALSGAPTKGLRVMVSGTIPPSAGLSSSSALVCAAALAMVHAYSLKMTREEIASICARCERYIGTEGGGMDQAIAMLATAGCAKMINFDPLRSEDVPLPNGACFVIAHSLAELNKASTAHYNIRVVECRIAAQIIGKKCGLEWRTIRKLGELQTRLQTDLPTMCELVQQHLHEPAYVISEILGALETSEEELLATSLTENTKDLRTFRLHQRAMHVYQEAQRVQLFHDKASLARPGVLNELGALMNASHESLRDLYECSHPRLDRLVELGGGGGNEGALTFGSRLTGAGWGGCIVALVQDDNVDAYVRRLKDEYYTDPTIAASGGHQRGSADTGAGDVDLSTIVFVTEPQAGATIYVE